MVNDPQSVGPVELVRLVGLTDKPKLPAARPPGSPPSPDSAPETAALGQAVVPVAFADTPVPGSRIPEPVPPATAAPPRSRCGIPFV